MALPATMYHLQVQLSDVDRQVYEPLDLRIARHPSETMRFMLTRTLAYCLDFEEGIAFSRGLSTQDEPAVWVRDLQGTVTAWIDVGAPSVDRLHKARKAVRRVSVYTHQDPKVLQREAASRAVFKADTIAIQVLETAFLDALEEVVDRKTAESAMQIRARIVDHARRDGFVTTDGPTAWGAGKLDLLAASELSWSDGQAPAVTLHATSPVLVGSVIDVAPQVTDDGPPEELRARWDLDSDGHADTAWIQVGPQHVVARAPGVVDVRIEVLDSQGNLAAASLRIDVARALPTNRDEGIDWRSLRADGGCACRSTGGSARRWPAVALCLVAWLVSRHRRVPSRRSWVRHAGSRRVC